MDITVIFHSSINMQDDISFVTKIQVHDTRTVTMRHKHLRTNLPQHSKKEKHAAVW